MKSRKKIALLSITTVLIIVILNISLYINNTGFNNVKLMYTLSTTNKAILSMNEDDKGNGYYLTKEKHPFEVIKERMGNEGWVFIQQEGSGYFFEKGNQKAVVTTTIWHRNYVKISVEKNIVNMADIGS